MRPPVVGSCGKSWSHNGSNDEASPRTSVQKGWTAITSLTSARHQLEMPAYRILEFVESAGRDEARGGTARSDCSGKVGAEETRIERPVVCVKKRSRCAHDIATRIIAR